MPKQKPQRINLSTKPADIVNTMATELKAVLYQKRKAHGGTRKYEAWKQELHDRAMNEKQNQMSELMEYISPVGNRWVMYSSMEYLPESKHVLPTHASFIYYETYGSCGAFFPTFAHGSRVPNGVVIFTSHFFLRMCDRAKIPFRSKAMIQEFIATNFMRSVSGQDKVGGEMIMRFRNGFGRGKVKSVEPYVVEVRTFLTDEELTPSQRKHLRIADLHAHIVDRLGITASPFTLEVLERVAYFFAVLAQQWEGFNPKDYSSVELLTIVVDQMSPNFFDRLLGEGRMTNAEMEQYVDDTCALIISVAESFGYKGWTVERVRQGVVDVMRQAKERESKKENEQ